MAEPTEARCVICTTPREAPRGMICNQHFDRLAQMLRDVESESCFLDARPSMAIRTGSGKGSLASERAPARLDVLAMLDFRTYPYAKPPAGPACVHCWHDSCIALRAWDNAVNARATNTMSVLDTLHGWARVVREDRDHASPERVTVTSERDCLTRNLEWLAEQGFIDEVYADVRNLLGQLRSANQTAEIRPKMVGICPTLLETEECGGRLWPDENRGEVVCDNCDRIFGFEELRHLGEMLMRQGYVEIFRVGWVTGVPVGTIRRWVSEGRCTSEMQGKKLAVRVGEVETLRDRRKKRAS
jgi:hypothetical protein